MSRAQLQALGERLSDVLERLVPPGPVALIDFPDHPNVGDSLIWVGESRWLRQHADRRLRYVADLGHFNLQSLRDAMPHGCILIHGGGNFGDLWPEHQALRERLLEQCPEYQVVQLPQSIHFDQPGRIEQCRRAVGGHDRFTLLLRDAESDAWARAHLDTETILVPDAAFLVNDLSGPAPTKAAVVLQRTDKESQVPWSVHGLDAEDWLRDDWNWLQVQLRYRTSRWIGDPSPLGAMAARVLSHSARARVARGVRQLSAGRVIVTDRLHAAILGLLLDRRVVALDNSYGKLRRVLGQWLPNHDRYEIVTDPSALEAAIHVAAQAG